MKHLNHTTAVLVAGLMLATWSTATAADGLHSPARALQPAPVKGLQTLPRNTDRVDLTKDITEARGSIMDIALRISEVSLGQQQGCFVELAGLAGLELTGIRLVADYEHGRSVIALRGAVGDDGYYLVASDASLGEADMVSRGVCFDNDLRRVSLQYAGMVISEVAIAEGSMPGVAASCLTQDGMQWMELSRATPGYDNACDCIDFDGDGYGIGPGCLGPDCSDALVNCNIDCRQDVDRDSIPDCFDECPLDSHKITGGECGCGVPDTDSDHDGYLDCVDECPADPGKITGGVCGCGVPDSDSDGDGYLDCIDECPADPGKHYPGLCGCGISNGDSDHDSIPDCIDECPADGHKIQAGVCGCGVPDTDRNHNGVIDCLEHQDEHGHGSDHETAAMENEEGRMSGWVDSGAAVSHPSIHNNLKRSTGLTGSTERSTMALACDNGVADAVI